MEDGSIVINTELDTSGFSSGTNDMMSTIANFGKRLDETFKAIKDTTERDFRGASSGYIESMSKQIDEALTSVNRDMNALLDKSGYVQGMPSLEWIETYGSIFDEIQAKMDLVFESATNLKNELYSANSKDKIGFIPTNEVADYIQKEQEAIAKAQEENTAQKGLNDTLREQVSLRKENNAESSGEGEGFWGKLWESLKNTMGKIKEAIGNMFKSKGGDSVLGKMLKPLTSFGGMLKRMVVRRIMMSIINGVREGMQNLARYSKSVEANLTTLKSALGQLKNSFATAFAPILSAVTPALATLINYLSQAITMVAQFFSALGGSTTFVRAKAYTDSYTSSVGGASKATKELEKQLAGFDELEILSANKGGGGGGGGGGVNPSDMFETVEVSQSVLDLTEALREAIASGDFQAIGEEIGNLFNKGIATIQWSDMGKNLATGLNKAVRLINGFLITADFEAVGSGLMKFITSGINNFDFRTLGSAVSGIIKSALGFISGLTEENGISGLIEALFNGAIAFIQGFDLNGIISAITTILTNIIKDLPNILLTILEGLGGLFVTFSQALFGAIFTVPEGYFTEFDAVQDKVNEVLGNIELDAQTHMDNVATIMGDAEVARDYVDALDQLNQKEHLSVEDKAEMERLVGLLNEMYPELNLELDEETGHLNMTNDELNTYIDNQEQILLLEATRARQSQILQQITDAYSSQKEVVEKLKEKEKELADSRDLQQSYRDIIRLSEEGQTETDELGNQFRLTKEQAEKYRPVLDQLGINYSEVNGEIVFMQDEVDKLNTAIETEETVIRNTSAKIDEYKTDLGELDTKVGELETEYNELNKIVKEGGDVIGYYKGKTNEAKEGLKGFASEAKKINTKDIGENIVGGISKGIDSQKSALLTKASNLAKDIKKKLQNALSINSPSKVMEDEVGKWIPLGLAEGIEDTTPKALQSVSNLADSIANEVSNEDFSAEILPKANMDKFADTIVGGFEILANRLEAITERIAYKVPSIADGLMPYATSSSQPDKTSMEMQRFLSSSISNMTSQIVNAINTNGNTNITIDAQSLSDSVVNEINKKTRRLNASPLVV